MTGVEQIWTQLKTAVQDAAGSVLGYVKGHREEWISEETWILIQEKKEVKQKMETSENEIRRFFQGKT